MLRSEHVTQLVLHEMEAITEGRRSTVSSLGEKMTTTPTRGRVWPSRLFLCIIIADALVLIAGTIIDILLQYDFYLACGIAVAGTITFVSLLYHSLVIREGSKSDGVRDSIACSFLFVYLLLVIYSVFFASSNTNSHPAPETETLLNSFTTATSIVIGFYFATGTVDKFAKSRKSKSKEPPVNVGQDSEV